MQLTLVHIGARPQAKDPMEAQIAMYLKRCSAFAKAEAQDFRTEEAFLEWLSRQEGRTSPVAVLLDSRGKLMSSEEFAGWMGKQRDGGSQQLIFAIGPASGWSKEALGKARLTLSFGPMTMAHVLARLVLAEQLYRAFTILTGHPYHGGH